MTFAAANASLKPGWKIVREGKHFALLWQSRHAKLGRCKVVAVGSLQEVVSAHRDLIHPLPG
jgi:hypothetical protein